MTSVFLLNGCSRFSMQTDFVAGSTSSFDTFLDDFFRAEVSSNTINLHFSLLHPENYGITETPITPRAVSRKKHLPASRASLENTLAALAKYDRDALPPSGQLTYDVLQNYLKTELSASDLTLYDEPLRPTTGIQSQLPVLYEEYRFRQPADVEDYLALLALTGDYFDQIIRFEQQKAQAGLFYVRLCLQHTVSQCNAFTADPDQHYLIQTFNHKIDAMSELTEDQKTLYKEKNAALGAGTCASRLHPSLPRRSQSFSAAAKNDMGLCYFADGKDYYRYLVCHNTGSASDLPALQDRILEKRQSDLQQAAALLSENPQLKASQTTVRLPAARSHCNAKRAAGGDARKFSCTTRDHIYCKFY